MNWRLSEIIFHIRIVNFFAYKQVLKYYKEDIDKYHFNFFQQDGSISHSSKVSRNMFQNLFKKCFFLLRIMV